MEPSFLKESRTLIAILVSSAVLASCATGATVYKVATGSHQCQPLRSSEFKAISIFQDLKGDDLQAGLCSSGKANRKIKFLVTGVLPKHNKGTPIDHAAKSDVKAMDYLRKYMKNWFNQVTLPSDTCDPLGDLIYTIRIESPSKLNEAGIWPNAASYDRGSDNKKDFVSHWSQLYVPIVDATNQLFAIGSGAICQGHEHSFGDVTQTGCGAVELPLQSLASSSASEGTYPLVLNRYKELDQMISEYALVLSKEQQHQLIGDQIREANSVGQIVESYIGLDHSNKVSIQNTVRDRKILWRHYFNAMTSVKEAKTDNPRLIQFEVSLNLDPFCQYARKVSDLIAQ